MRVVKITEDFTGYPSGRKRAFEKGQVVEVPDDFADLAIGKGHAKEPEPKVEERPAPEAAPAKRSVRP
ncbi:hypothetical protein [Enterovirga rhinocerotis]|uniref:Uncharacterized protein n=1 Tax=Enterovirga rhinocerotis TaxID=1339210 RepID=A0A4R7BYF3_9HYPH|nr:hypothetical protein [Enterovirga rhinocerotis]TDR90292.1 hypothetical protein EV668_3138 [Enterovirga rhinocerotis]